MMKVCFMLLAYSFYAINYVLSTEIPKCETWGRRFGEGEVILNKEKCMKATCANPTDNSVTVMGCPMYKIKSDCHLTEIDLSKEYPKCCPQVVCPK